MSFALNQYFETNQLHKETMVAVRFTNRLIALLLLLPLFPSIQARSQELAGSSLTIKDGLIDPSIYSMVQDKRGFMWFGSWKGLSKYDTRELKNYTNDPNNPRSISSDFVRACHSDKKGRLWFGTNWGLNLYDPVTDSFDRFLKDSANVNSLSDNMIICLMEDEQGDLWVGTSNGVNRVRTVDNKITVERYLHTENPKEKKKYITAMYKDPDGIVWVSASHALMAFDPRKKKVEYMSFPFEDDPENKSVLTLYGDKSGNMWIGSRYKGLGKFDRKHKKFHSFRNLAETNEEKSDVLSVMQIIPARDGSLLIRTSRGILSYDISEDKLEHGISHNLLKKKLRISGILRIYLDSEENLWIGTLADGLHYITKRNNFFIPISVKNKEINVEQVLLDPNNKLWFQSYDRDRMGGTQNTWYHLDKINHSLVPVSTLSGYTTKSYFDRNGSLWMGLVGNVIVNYKVVSGKLEEKRRYILPHTPSSTEDQITVIGEDKSHLIVGTAFNGLYVFDREKEQFLPYNILPQTPTGATQKYISYLFCDSKNNLWIGTTFGVTKISPNNRKQFYQTANVTQAASTNRTVNSVHEDMFGQIWMVLSNDGLYLYDVAKNVFVSKNKSKEIYGQNIRNIQHDNYGNLWLSNELGIVEYNIAKDKARQFFFYDGIPGSRLMSNSALKTQDGHIYITTNNGAVYFNPKNIPFNRQPPSVVFTRLRLYNKPVNIGDETEILKQSLSESNEITFRHDQSIFSIDFAALSFSNIEKNEYAYKLDGFEKAWNYVKTPTATYTNLPAGQYTLLVKGANSDGVWSSKGSGLRITILPPWWNSWYSWIAYIILFTTAAYHITRFLWQRRVFRQEAELHEVKLNFFTNISHEIRTRLMLITGPVEQLLSSERITGSELKLLTYVSNSSESLLNLVSELMDFRKIESGYTRLAVRKYDLIPFVKHILAVFEHLSKSRNIHTVFSSSSSSIYLWFDSEQFQKVIYNILSNAYKFTDDDDEVRVSIEETDKNVTIEIADNGKGIAPEYLDKLFHNYFQVDESKGQNTGYGIGLALSKAIVESMHGKLEVTSKQASGDTKGQTVFRIALLKGREHFDPALIAPEIVDKNVAEDISALSPTGNNQYIKRETILFAEDNDELRAFVSDSLNWLFNIISVRNGKEAWEICTAQPPDLIISDVMMAEMDGLELCQKIRSDIRTSHIPIILLTARTAVPNQIEGLKHGADLYVAKPLSMRILELNIKNLLDSRKLLQQRYSRHISLSDKIIDMDRNKDDEFLNRIVQFVEDNIEDRAIGVPELCLYIGMSKTVLYQKLRALTDMTVNDFVKLIRLKLAARLLRDDRLSVQEVAFRVGYDDRKYFSKEFKKHFGENPSEFASQQLSNE